MFIFCLLQAIETNEIPRKVHSFADFEADRFRNAR